MAKGALMVVLALLVPMQALANEALWALGKKHAGRFASEVGALPEPVLVRLPPDTLDLYDLRYDQELRQLVSDSPPTLKSGTTEFACRPGKAYVGVNAFGSRYTVRTESCRSLEIEDTDDGMLVGHRDCSEGAKFLRSLGGDVAQACEYRARKSLRIDMSPDEYRAIKSQGFAIDVRFAAFAGAQQEVAYAMRRTITPTISSPFEQSLDWVRIQGRIKSVTLLTPDRRRVLATFERDPPPAPLHEPLQEPK